MASLYVMSRNLGNTCTYAKISLTLNGRKRKNSFPFFLLSSITVWESRVMPGPVCLQTTPYLHFLGILPSLGGHPAFLIPVDPLRPLFVSASDTGNSFCLGPPVATGAMDSAITRDASSCSRWELIQRPQLDSLQRVEGLRTLSPKCVVSIEPLPLGSGSCEEEEAERF